MTELGPEELVGLAAQSLRAALGEIDRLPVEDLDQSTRFELEVEMGHAITRLHELCEKVRYTRACAECGHVSLWGLLCERCERSWTPGVAAL